MQWGGLGKESEVCKLGFDPGSIGRVLAQRESRHKGFVDDPSAEYLNSSTQLDTCTKRCLSTPANRRWNMEDAVPQSRPNAWWERVRISRLQQAEGPPG